jgi:hypothetical protein
MDTAAETCDSGAAPQQDITNQEVIAAQSCNTSSTSADGVLLAPFKTSTSSRQCVPSDLFKSNQTLAVFGAEGIRSNSNSGGLQTLLHLPVPWWQHVLVSCLSMAVMATYVSWESGWCGQDAAAVRHFA